MRETSCFSLSQVAVDKTQKTQQLLLTKAPNCLRFVGSTINRYSSLRSKRFRWVSEQRKTEERDSRFWPREKCNKNQKNEIGGRGGEGRKRLQTNPSILKTCVRQRTQRLIGSASRTMLIKGLFHTERTVWYVTRILILSGCCLFWSARFALQCKNIFFDLF